MNEIINPKLFKYMYVLKVIEKKGWQGENTWVGFYDLSIFILLLIFLPIMTFQINFLKPFWLYLFNLKSILH